MRLDERAKRDLARITKALGCPEPHAVAAALYVFRRALEQHAVEVLEGYEDRLTDYYIEDGT